jgi:ArsR family transcriptional regulator, arsenate/arsenite/antimonite-responsive transcriptional repressor
MGDAQAAAMLAALGHGLRLRLWRLLAPRGHAGLPAGDIATSMNVLPSSLSFHLRMMTQAGVLTQRRSSRRIIYAVNADTVKNLFTTLSDTEPFDDVTREPMDIFGETDGETENFRAGDHTLGEIPP